MSECGWGGGERAGRSYEIMNVGDVYVELYKLYLVDV